MSKVYRKIEGIVIVGYLTLIRCHCPKNTMLLYFLCKSQLQMAEKTSAVRQSIIAPPSALGKVVQVGWSLSHEISPEK